MKQVHALIEWRPGLKEFQTEGTEKARGAKVKVTAGQLTRIILLMLSYQKLLFSF